MLIVRIMEADYIGCDGLLGQWRLIILDVMLIVRIMEADYIGYNADC